jgi:hypothetical protein
MAKDWLWHKALNLKEAAQELVNMQPMPECRRATFGKEWDLERREFIAILSAIAVGGHVVEAAAKDLDPSENLTIEDHIRQLQKLAAELGQKLSPEDIEKLNHMTRKRVAAIDKFTAHDIKTLLTAAESGMNAGYCPKLEPGMTTWPCIARAEPGEIKRILIEGKVAVDRHNFVVTDAVASPQDKWKLAPVRYAADNTGALIKEDRSHDRLWGMRIAYLDVVPPGVMVMWTDLKVSYDPLTIKDPNAVVIVYI